MERSFDVVIIGGGPAGLTAGLYAARGGKSVALLEKMALGGQAAQANEVENYPAFERISGFDLAIKMHEQASKFGMKTLYENVLEMDLRTKRVITKKGEIAAKALILCMGAQSRRLGLEHEQELIGRGVSYCATCDGAFFKGKNVAIVGGGNTAASDALYLRHIANRVTLIHRRDELRATKVVADRVHNDQQIDKLWNSKITALHGEDRLEAITAQSVGGEVKIPVDALFVAIGNIPRTELVQGIVPTDKFGYIITNDNMEIDGFPMVFAAGDIRSKHLRQIITACADGAIAGEAASLMI